MNPAGPRAQSIADLMLFFCVVSTVVYIAVMAVLVWAMLRRRARAARAGVADEISDRKARLVITAAIALTVVTLITLGVSDFVVQRHLSAHPADALRIIVTGHQYWWEVEYEDPVPDQRLRTANELHIPIDRPVELVLTSRDVIHSFWVPSLMGKKDLIPGHTNTEVVEANRAGRFAGQCAEFCGLQHAQMRLVLYAESPERFEQWRKAQLNAARPPQGGQQLRGLQVFESSSCILCHTIQGTQASATAGPDLTHVASRSMIGAGTLANTPANLASWVLAPHRWKPGVLMPATSLPPEDLAALTSYLGSLQ
jgi:cytochrome c oxidase subunit 2